MKEAMLCFALMLAAFSTTGCGADGSEGDESSANTPSTNERAAKVDDRVEPSLIQIKPKKVPKF